MFWQTACQVHKYNGNQTIHSQVRHGVQICSMCVIGVDMGGHWGPTATGALVGGLYVMLNRFGMKRFWRAPRAPLNVVVTGGTKGIGKAMAREFLRCALTCRFCLGIHYGQWTVYL